MEGLAFLVNLSLLLIYILNKADATSSREYNLLGDIVVGGCSTINLMEIVFLVVKIIVGARAIDEYIMTHPKYPRTIWLQLFAFVGQQGGMGFEEMFVDPEAEKIFKAPKYLIGNGNRRVWAENQQQEAVQDRARGAFAASQPVRQTEQESTIASFFHNSSKDVVIEEEPVRKRENASVGSISDLVHREEDSSLRPFYWLENVSRTGPRNTKSPKTLVFSSSPSASSGSRSHSNERSQERKRQEDRVRNRSHERPQDLRSHDDDDPFKKKSLRKHKKRSGQPKIRHL